jgi:TPR repeat protein
MHAGDDQRFQFGGTRVPAGVAFLRLYRGDAMFRSSLDFAVIGLIVYLFVAPLPLPSLDLFGSAQTSAAGPKSAPTSAATPPPMPVDIAQAATPPPRKRSEKLSREWFTLSDPAIVPSLHQAADEIDAQRAGIALKVLDDIDKPNDRNVLNLTALAHLVTRDKDSMQRAFDFHLKAAQAGHPGSMNEVGQVYRLGAVGRVDLAAAVDWYERGAAAGSASAATNAGRAHLNGWARPVDQAKAYRYYTQAAEAGDPWGMHNLGAVLINGEGTWRDARRGREWIEKAAKAGLATAQINLAKLARTGTGGPLDITAFVQWAQAAADQGSAPALYDLGMFFLKPDDGRPADSVRAAGYLQKAAVKRHAPAQFAYATLHERGTGVQPSMVQAFVYYSLALRGGEKAAEKRLDALRARMGAQDLETAQRLVAAAS